MTQQFIELNLEFNAPVGEVFNLLSDHQQMGKILNTSVRRVKDGNPEINGLGSVRRIAPVPLPGVPFEETVTRFEPNRLIEYTVSKGSPIKNHLGRMLFSESGKTTKVKYTIQFESKLPIPFSGKVISVVLKQLLKVGLGKVEKQYK